MHKVETSNYYSNIYLSEKDIGITGGEYVNRECLYEHKHLFGLMGSKKLKIEYCEYTLLGAYM